MKLSVGGVPVRLTKTTMLVLLLCTGALGYAGYDYVQQSQALSDAVAVNATVTETDIAETGARDVSYEVVVRFTYEYEGRQYQSDRLYPTTLSPRFDSESKAKSVLAPYETNETVTAYVTPSSPDSAFLERQRTNAPFWVAGGGALVLVVALLNAAGARAPGQDTGVRPTEEHRPTRYETLLGLTRERINWLSKRLIVGAIALLVLALVATVLLVAAAEDSTVDAELTDPTGIALLSVFAAMLLLIGSLLLYGLWSITEYRRLRGRIPEPRPPSPFTHPTRLVTILRTDDDSLDEYGRRVRKTGFTFVAIGACLVVVLSIILR